MASGDPTSDRWSPDQAWPASADDNGRVFAEDWLATARIRLSPDAAAAAVRVATLAAAWCPTLAPSGDRVAYVTDRSGMPRVEVAPVDGDGPSLTVSGAGQEAISVAWSPDGDWLTYLVSPKGSIRAQLHAVRPDGTAGRPLAGLGDRETVFAGLWTREPGWYAFSLADGESAHACVRLVHVPTGELRRVPSTEGLGFVTLTGISPDGSTGIVRIGPRNRRRLFLVPLGDVSAPPVPVLTGGTAGDGTGGATGEEGRFARDGTGVYLRTPCGRDRTVLGFVPLGGGGRPGPLQVLAERPDADLEGYAVLPAVADPPGPDGAAPDGGAVLLIWNCDGVSTLELADLRSGSRQRIGLPGLVMPGWSLNVATSTLVAELTGPTEPRGLWALTVPLGGGAGATSAPTAPRRLAAQVTPRVPADLVTPGVQRYVAPDGQQIAGLLYRPAGVREPGPAVITRHGGPESQERPAFSALTQAMLAAGLTVFAPNVRGSTGYGEAFTAADDGERRASTFQDVRAAADFLVETGAADRTRLGVHGWSYGGYLALTSLYRWPDLFAAGSTHAGMSDLLSFFAETEPWMAAASTTEYGDPRTQADLLRALSPLTSLEQVTAPTLLVHGDRDTNVPVLESVRAHAALRAGGVPTGLLLLPGEGHTVVGAGHRAELALCVSSWFAYWLDPSHRNPGRRG